MKRAIRQSSPRLYEEAAVEAVSDQLAKQGVILRSMLTGVDEALVLQLPVIERYAGSLIVAARNNPRGVPVLEERLLGSPHLPLPGMERKDRVERLQERIVLECIVARSLPDGCRDGMTCDLSLSPASRQHLSEEPLRAFRLGLLEDLVRRAFFDHFAAVQDHDPVGGPPGKT